MTENWKPIAKKCMMMVLALWFSAGIFIFFSTEFSYRAILYVIVAFALHGLIERASQIRDRKVLTASLFFSIVLTAAFTAGHQINLWAYPYFRDIFILDWIYLLPFGGVVFVCVLNLVDWVLSKGYAFGKPAQTLTLKYWRNASLILLGLWLPYFCVFYPGNLSLDSFECVQQAIGDVPYGNNHPAAFVACVEVLVKMGMMVGDINFGIACFSLVQLLVFAVILGYVLFWLKSKGAPDWMVFLCGAFYGLNPMIGTYSVTMWKDVLFGAFLLLLATWLYDVAESCGQLLATGKGLALFSVISVFLSLWRNSMAMGMCILSAVLIVFYKKHVKYFWVVAIVVLCIIFVIQGPVYDSLGIPETNAAESYGIPLQQIGCTLMNDGVVDAESRAFLDQIIPTEKWAILYQPAGSDDVKFNESFDHAFFNANTGRFLKIWLKLMPSNLEYYIKAWLMNTIGYYHIGTIETAYWYGIIPVERAEELGIYRTDLIDKAIGTDLVARIIEAFLFFAKKLPVFTSLYSIATNVWVFFFGIMIRFFRREQVREYIWGTMPLVALWVIIMVTTPAFCEFRYMFAFHLALPVVLAFMFRRENAPAIE